ncbi:SH3 domain-containing protein [Pyxidicoccus xibeiensis]|uniref:SH3 domain-containing protein n=1 Tax=Pyxidicoccus xibeiensis TaxID=2906759 RepID=UPI0020A7A8C3|nr:SH3 domain-containing protein [Pyxidicoccus xibeiensis]MCP3142899.1 SH3 domain-containing protein [Pyxidicoccus xibeiensis]
MPSLLLSLLLATTAAADGGAGQPADAGVAKPGDAGVALAADAGTEPLLYVLGSSLNLRKEPSAQAEVVEKLPIGTACRQKGPAQGEWFQVCCGGKPGYVSASLMGPQKPSVEPYLAEVKDTRLPLEQRLESALRASTLEPRDIALRKFLGELFYKRQLELAAADKKPAKERTFTIRCHLMSEVSCIKLDIAKLIQGIGADGAGRDHLFVVALGNREHVKVFRGTYTTSPYPEFPETVLVTYTVLAEESFTPTDVLQKALFTICGTYAPCSEDPGSIPLGQFVLDETSQALLNSIPHEWAWLEPALKPRGFGEGPPFDMLWDCPEKKPLLLTFKGDAHGRWRVSFPKEGWGWLSAVEKAEEGLRLTLVEQLPSPKSTKQLLFKPPTGGKDIATLGDELFTSNLRRYARKHYYPCP